MSLLNLQVTLYTIHLTTQRQLHYNVITNYYEKYQILIQRTVFRPEKRNIVSAKNSVLTMFLYKRLVVSVAHTSIN